MESLVQLLTQLTARGVLLAFSGGVDSALLLSLLSRIPGARHAVTFATAWQDEAELTAAQKLAQNYHVPWEALTLDPVAQCPELRFNPKERCYLCKRELFRALQRRAAELQLTYLVDGTNADDLHVFRPGRRALQELGVRSPLAELGITKVQVRQFAAELGVPVAHRPAAPCLATRLPYGAELKRELLLRIAQGENFLKSCQLPTVRLRVHGDVVRLEVPPEDFAKVLTQREPILARLHELGFHYLTLDLAGFRSGSMDE